MKFNKIILQIIVCLICLTGAAFSQKVLEKPLQKWSKDDAIKILSNSPWAETYQSSEASGAAIRGQRTERDVAQTASSGGSNPGSTVRIFGVAPITVRLHSALPVRQAMIRLRQIQAGYDKMNENKRAEFDAMNKVYLDCAACKSYYVVTLSKSIDTSQGVEDGIFQTMTLEQLKGNIKLVNDKDEIRELIHFTAPKSANDFAYLFFARKGDKSDALLTSQNKKFKLVFDNTFLGNSNPYAKLLPRNFEFNVSKMIINENIEF